MFRWTILDGDIYVDGALGSDANTGTISSPVLTLNRAQQLCVSANLRVIVRGGIKYGGTFGSRTFGLQWIGDGRPIVDGNLTTPIFRAGDSISNFYFVNGNLKALIPSRSTLIFSLNNCTVLGFAIMAIGWNANNSILSLSHVDTGGGFTGTCIANSCVFVNCNQNRSTNVSGHSCYFKNNVGISDGTIYSANSTTVPIPKFADEARYNYSLLPDSPLIGQGRPDALDGTRLDIGPGGVFFGVGVASPETFESNGAVWSKTGPLNDLYVDTDRWVKRIGVASGSIRTTVIDLQSEYYLDNLVQGIYQTFAGNVPSGGVPSVSMRWGSTMTEILGKTDTLMQFYHKPTVDASGDGNGAAGWDAASAVPIKARFIQFTFTISDTDY